MAGHRNTTTTNNSQLDQQLATSNSPSNNKRIPRMMTVKPPHGFQSFNTTKNRELMAATKHSEITEESQSESHLIPLSIKISIYSYETGNHIFSEESGYLKDINDENPAGTLVQKGSYSYDTPDGQVRISQKIPRVKLYQPVFYSFRQSTLNIKLTKKVSALPATISLLHHPSAQKFKRVLI